LNDQIYSSAQRAAKLTRSLLAFSRKQQIVTAPVNLNELIEQMHDFLERIIGEDVELRLDLSDDSLTVLADRSQIEQVIMNIVSNARDAMPDGGCLTISTSLGNLDGRAIGDDSLAADRYVVLTLEDTGVGITNPEKERIFEPFFTTKEVGKGTGLGLSMAYGIIRQHNGWIFVESKVGEGTRFTVYLPQWKQTKVAENSLLEIQGHGVESILLVEDDEMVLQANVELLEENGYRVLSARNGAEAIEYFKGKGNDIDLAIIDVIMPHMNGRQLYEAMKIIAPHLRVMFISGYTFDVLDRTGLPDKCPFVSKPLIPQEFLQKVRNLLDEAP